MKFLPDSHSDFVLTVEPLGVVLGLALLVAVAFIVIWTMVRRRPRT
jgi:cell division protein FtsW (lipid II flippase)